MALAVSSLAVSLGCGDDGSDEGATVGGDTGATTGTASDATGSTADTTQTASTTDGSETATTEGDGETRATDETAEGTADTGSQFYCETIADAQECEAHPDCTWEPGLGICLRDCPTIEDEATCNETGLCFWDGETCQFGGI